MGYLLGICVKKNSKLPLSDAARKYKGRVLSQGDRVVSQNYDADMLQDLGSSPATMEAANFVDLYGCVPGHALEIADAIQAYVQVDMKGTPTWVCPPLTRGQCRGNTCANQSADCTRRYTATPTPEPSGRRNVRRTLNRGLPCHRPRVAFLPLPRQATTTAHYLRRRLHAIWTQGQLK